MSTQAIYEIIGYTGSALVVISMLMTSIVRLRTINLIGSVIFTCYALLIRSYPTAAMNLFLVGINIYQLVRMLKTRRVYDLIPLLPEDGYYQYLLNSSLEDIRYWMPEFSVDEQQPDMIYLVCCERNPAGLFLAKDRKDGTAEVLLDYATPVYRDTSVAQFVYSHLAEKGFHSAVFRMNAPKHTPYMEKIGYRKNDRGEYVLKLSA